MIRTVSQMLDLPKQERSRYLAALPFTRTKAFWAMEGCHHKFIRRLMRKHGGIWRENYCMFGLSMVATFRNIAGMNGFAKDVCDWYNADLRKSHELHGHIKEEELADLLWKPSEFWMQAADVPALEFGVENFLGDEPRIYRTNHKGEALT